MIGLDAAFSEYWENGTPCREALRFFLTQRPAGDACSVANYELILDGDAVTLKDSVSPEKLAEIFSSDFLLTCGAFFFYPPRRQEVPWAPGRDYLASPCQAAVLVHDVGFFEIYSKEAPYFQKCLTFLNQMGPDVEVEIIEESNRFCNSLCPINVPRNTSQDLSVLRSLTHPEEFYHQ